MASSCSAVWSSGFLVPRDNLVSGGGKFKISTRHSKFCNNVVFRTSSFPDHSLRFQELWTSRNCCFSFRNGRNGSLLLGFRVRREGEDSKSRTLMCATSGNKITHWEKMESNKSRRKFSLRLGSRLKFVARKMRRLYTRSMLKDVVPSLRKNRRSVLLSAALSFALGMCYLLLKFTAVPSPKTVPYSEFITSLQSGSVTKVLLEEGSRRIYYDTLPQGDENVKMLAANSPEIGDANTNFRDMVVRHDVNFGQVLKLNMFRKLIRPKRSAPAWHYSTRKIDRDEKFLLNLMREKGISYSSAPQSVWVSIRSALLMIISLWIHLTPLMWLLYRQLSPTKTRARKQRPDSEPIGFDDVQGVDAAKNELMEIVSCLQGSISYSKLGARLPRGILLVGPPGTGKTLLARAVAGEAGVPFFSVSASEFVEMYVGRGAARIRDLFKNARKAAPSIIFIDEIDGVGGKRGRSFNDERDQTLNQLLTEMDGFESEMKVVVIAATNRPEALDPALCRAGRFSRKVYVGEPNEEGRRKILAVHLKGVPLEEDADLICNLVASLTQGFVGADLANITNEAALLAARRGGETVTREDIMEAVERAKFGINEQQLRPGSIRKELGKLFPWMPSLMGRTSDMREEGQSGALGYQTLS